MNWLKSRKTRIRLAWCMFWASLLGWPISIWLTDEPVFILSLSWFAITITALDMIMTADIKE